MNTIVDEWTEPPAGEFPPPAPGNIVTEKPALPPIVDAAEFLTTPMEKPAELIEGVLHRGSKLVLGGGSKAFKTWALLALALAVCMGRSWLGRKATQGKVLFLNFEIQEYAWQDRIKAVAGAMGITLTPGLFKLWNLRGKASNYLTLLPQITEAIRGDDFSLIVLDPIYKLYGNLDENKAGDVAALLNGLEALAVETGAAIAFGAHFSKGNQSGKEALDRISGSGVFARDPDSILIFTRHEEEDCFTVDSILRNFAPVPPFAVRWQYPLFSPDDDLDPAKLKQSNASRKREHDPRKILQAIAHTTPDKGISVSAWANALNIHRTTLNGYLTEMRSKGLIATAGEGNAAKQYITPKGRELL